MNTSMFLSVVAVIFGVITIIISTHTITTAMGGIGVGGGLVMLAINLVER